MDRLTTTWNWKETYDKEYQDDIEVPDKLAKVEDGIQNIKGFSYFLLKNMGMDGPPLEYTEREVFMVPSDLAIIP